MATTALQTTNTTTAFNYDERRFGILSGMFQARYECSTKGDLKNQTFELIDRSGKPDWQGTTRSSIALSAGVIFEPTSTNSLRASLKDLTPESIYSFLQYVPPVNKLDHISRFENNARTYTVGRRGGQSSDNGTLTPA